MAVSKFLFRKPLWRGLSFCQLFIRQAKNHLLAQAIDLLDDSEEHGLFGLVLYPHS